MRPVETIPKMGGRMNENGGWSEFMYDAFDTL
jgi:hypothetical protein